MNEHRSIVGRPFPKGQSGNPGGRPKALRDIVELAQSHAPDAIETLTTIMRNEEAPAAARIGAASAILDRAFGKAPQAVQMSGLDGGPIEQRIEITDEDRAAALAEFIREMQEKNQLNGAFGPSLPPQTKVSPG